MSFRQMGGRATGLTLVLMAGVAGTGKSTLALALGAALGWPVVDKDTLKSTLLSLGLAELVAAPAAYELMLNLGRDLLVEQRLSVILDSPASFRQSLSRASQIASEAQATLRVVLCQAPREVRARRLTSRVARLSQPKEPDEAPLKDEEQRYVHLPQGALKVDTTQPIASLLPTVLAHLGV